MEQYQNLSDFWQHYFTGQAGRKEAAFDNWVIVRLSYDKPLLVIDMADVLAEQGRTISVSNVSPEDLRTLALHYKQRFSEQYPKRFGFFKPQTDKVLTEYPDWQTFSATWIGDDPRLLGRNLPLLFDYPSQQEYDLMKLRDADPAGYRRLQVVLYQYRKQRFLKFFIGSVTDQQWQQIRQDMASWLGKAMPTLITDIEVSG